MAEGGDQPPGAKTYVLGSRETIDIDLKDVLEDGKITVFPHVIDKPELLTLSFIKNKVRLSAGKYIGLIPLAPGVLVDVRPKLPITNLAHVLDVAMHPVESIAGIERNYLETDIASESVTNFITTNFLRALQDIQRYGWLKEYIQRTEITSHPKGRIDLAGTLRNCWSRGAMHQVRSRSFQQTSDIPVNRLLRHMLEILLLSRSGGSNDQGITARANNVFSEFPSSIGKLRSGDRAACEDIVARRSLPSTRSYYYRALEIALMVMSGQSISFQSYGADVTLDTAIIDFETVFEDYSRRVLQRQAGNSVIVKDGNFEGKRPLFDNKSHPPAQPDIVVVSAAGGSPVIADVKYKDRPARPDVNQIVTYALVYRAKRVVLIHQNRPGTRRGLSLIGTISHVEVYDYAIDLDVLDLTVEEENLATAVFGLLA